MHKQSVLTRDIDLLLADIEDVNLSKEDEEDAQDLLAVCLSYVGPLINIRDLDNRAKTEDKIGIEKIRALQKSLESGGVKLYDLGLDAKECVETLKRAIERFDVADRDSGRGAALGVLQLSLTSALDTTVMHIDASDPVIVQLEEDARNSLGGMHDTVIMRIFSSIQWEFSEERGSGEHFSESSPIVPEDFLRPVSVPEAKERIAAYLTRIRPALIREKLEANRSSNPADAPGLAQILATSIAVIMSDSDRRVLNLLGRLFSAWGQTDRILRSSGLPGDSWLAKRILKRKSLVGNSVRPDYKCALAVMRRILGYTDLYIDRQSKVEKTFQNYKLGLELFFRPDSSDSNADELGALGEIELQRHLCRYLIDHDVLSYGVAFGRSEIDLITHHGEETFIVEAKVYRHVDDWLSTPAHLGQLRHYMDQNVGPRGILVIYNRAGISIDAPKRWLRGRFWILVINLCPTSPSKTPKNVMISEDDAELIRMEPNFPSKSPRARTSTIE